jgi:hypothetical protein
VSVCLSLKFPAAGNVLTVRFIRYISKDVVPSRVNIYFYRTDCHKRSDSEGVFCGVYFYIVSKIIANARTDVRREMKV